MTQAATHRAIEAVWRIESAKVIAHVARLVRDVGLAEELAQDALVAALEHWPDDGLPNNPGAWLMATAKNRALDRLRQDALHARKHEEFGADLDALQSHVVPDFVDALAEASQRAFADGLPIWVIEAMAPYAQEALQDRFGDLDGFDRHVGIGAIRLVHYYLMGGWGLEDTARPELLLRD